MADFSDDQNLPAAGDVSVVFDDSDVPEEEREEILQEIETMVGESRPAREIPEEFLRPRRSGVAFPILINLVAVAAVAAGIYFISEYFRIREDSIALESQSYFSAEAQLIEEILRESEEQLARKDQEITQIQTQLARLDEEKQSLEEDLEGRVAEREAELRAQLDAELAAERARLAEAGQSEADINQRLAEIEAQREQEFNSELESFRAEAEAELNQLAAELEQRESELQQTLAASQEERTRIAQEAAEREQELRAELGAEIEALEEAEQEAQARISELQALREEESLLADRVLGSFAVIVDDIQEGLTDEAITGLDSLERLLRDQTPVDSEAQRRRRTELALASTLRGLIQEVDVLRDNIAVRDLTTSDEEEAALEQQRAAELIQTAAGVVELAEQAREAGRVSEARSLYQQALNTIPSLDQVYPGILDLERNRRHVIMQSAIGEAQNLLAAGANEAAVTTYLEALREVSEGEEDPLLTVASGIAEATEQNQRDLLDSQQDIADELEADIAERDRQIAGINQQLLTTRNQLSTRDATISELRTQVDTLSSQLEARQESISDRAEELAAARARATELEDEIASLEVDLRTAQARVTSLEDALETARSQASGLEESESALATRIAGLETSVESLEEQLESARRRADRAEARSTNLEEERDSLEEQVDELESEVSALEQQVATLETRLEDRPEVPADQMSTATQAEIDGLNATIAEQSGTIEENEATIEDLNATIESLNSDISELNAEIEELSSTVSEGGATTSTLESQLQRVRAELRAAEQERDLAQTDLETAREEVSGLEDQISALRDQRDTIAAQTDALEAQVEDLTEEVTLLTAYRNSIEELADEYSLGLRAAVQLASNGNYDTARQRILSPLRSDTANEILPGIATNIEEIYAGLIREAEGVTTGEARSQAFADVEGLTEQVKKNLDDPQGSAAVESYLRREPDIRDVADEIFEIIELSARSISAPEVEYRLLGSVSRVTGNLVVVERLVALESEVGDRVEIRRTPELGQEVPVGLGTIIEVTDRRVVVSVDEIYQLDSEPELADVVYQAEE